MTEVPRSPVRVRPATADDIPAITALYAREVAEGVATYEVEAPDATAMGDRWRAITTQGYPYLVAELDGRLAGYAYASSYRTRAGYRWTVEDTVYVDAECAGRGVGRSLLDALIHACQALGFRQMIAVVGDRQNAASIALHESFGFRVVGIFEGIGRKHGRWLDGVQMQRPLGDGSTTPPAR